MLISETAVFIFPTISVGLCGSGIYFVLAIYGYPTHDVSNPLYIVYGISVNKLIYREQWDDKPYIAAFSVMNH